MTKELGVRVIAGQAVFARMPISSLVAPSAMDWRGGSLGDSVEWVTRPVSAKSKYAGRW